MGGGRIERKRRASGIAIDIKLKGASGRASIDKADAGAQGIERAGDFSGGAFDLLGEAQPDADLIALNKLRQGKRAPAEGAVELPVGEIYKR